MKQPVYLMAIAIMAAMAWSSSVVAGPLQDKILQHYKSEAGSGTEFSAKRGEAFFRATHTGGKPKTPSCTTCHTTSPGNKGKTRANKDIAPMALSKTPDRFSDLKKVEKWFRRNCRSVLGRECTPAEKGDFLAFMISQ